MGMVIRALSKDLFLGVNETMHVIHIMRLSDDKRSLTCRNLPTVFGTWQVLDKYLMIKSTNR